MRFFFLAMAIYALGWLLFGGIVGALIGLAVDGALKGAAVGAGACLIVAAVAELLSRDEPQSFLQRIADLIEQARRDGWR